MKIITAILNFYVCSAKMRVQINCFHFFLVKIFNIRKQQQKADA